MTGCAFCGMKGFRVCDRCQRSNAEAMDRDLRTRVEPEPVGAPEMHGHIRCEPPRYEDVFKLGSEPEPVELTVEDAITSLEYTALTCGLRLAKRDPSGVGEIRTGSISWSKWAPREHETPAGFSLWTADEEAELFRADNVRDVLIEAKKRGLL